MDDKRWTCFRLFHFFLSVVSWLVRERTGLTCVRRRPRSAGNDTSYRPCGVWRGDRGISCAWRVAGKSRNGTASRRCAPVKKTQNPKPISFFCPSRLFPSLITCSCFLRRDRRGKERWQKLQLNGTDRAELAASAALESLLLLAGGGVDKTTWPSVGGILASWRRSVELKSQRRNFELEMHHEGKAIRVCLPSHNNNKSLK